MEVLAPVQQDPWNEGDGAPEAKHTDLEQEHGEGMFSAVAPG